ncbi:MAG TPA: hypothetical protein VE091_16200 [Gemmatimonadales bacterium]|nr:hypothetical protein [Gemmatimonadales bacterium]
MSSDAMTMHPALRSKAARSRLIFLLASGLLALPAGIAAQASYTAADAPAGAPRADRRVGLSAGVDNAGEAIENLKLIAHQRQPAGFFDSATAGKHSFVNSDLAFSGNYIFQGNYYGLQVWDISNPKKPTLRTSLVCPGGQGDPSVYKNLLFLSVEQTSGRLDCGRQGVTDTVSAERFRGVRIFDISDLDHPKQVADVQTCRGSHTHTLVTDLNDDQNVYIYVSGTSVVRSGNELAGCSGKRPDEDPNTSLFRIDIIKVPLASPQDAKIVSSPRLFADSSGNIAGLWKGGTHGEGTQETEETNMCHDITVYQAVGLAAGACSGNGLLLDVKDPANPKRIAEVSDPNFAYWHSATFNNDATKVLYTDEWGGGGQARCRASDPPKWGADAIYTLANGTLTPASFYKLPAVQTDQENCVAHNGSLIPVPGRDIMVQAWYQGGVSVFDFTDPAHPVEIAYFDRGPLNAQKLEGGGYWSAYWYNGHIVGSEITRGLDLFELKPSDQLSKNEIEAAKLVKLDLFNPQAQPKLTWPASFVVARAYLDQLERNHAIPKDRASAIGKELKKAEKQNGEKRVEALTQLAAALEQDASGSTDAARVKLLQGSVTDLANAAH